MKESVLNNIWEENTYNEEDFINIFQKYINNKTVAKLLAQRNIRLEEIPQFLDSKIKDHLPNPFDLKDMNIAVNRIITAIEKKEKVCIFADYDADGTSSCALLNKVLSFFLSEIIIYIPNRFKEGYGLNISAINYLRSLNTNLIITVDCGTISHEPISLAQNINIDVVVIDHHVAPIELPKASAIINPHRLDQNTANCKNLAAVGVVFLFCVALVSTLKKTSFSNIANKINLLNYLDLVALGTICDSVSLIGVNRAFVKQGLKVLNCHNNIGLKALCNISTINQDINSNHIGFVLGPKINAAGRVGEAKTSSQLLFTDNENEALQLAITLDKHNEERKQIESDVFKEALEQINEPNNKLILVAKDNWHQGVIGIVAGKLKELYNKTTIVISWNGDIGKASCRSIPEVDIGKKILIAKSQGLLLDGGGHPMAGGFTIKKKHINEFHLFLNESIEKDLTKLKFKNAKFYSIEVDGIGVTKSLWQDLIKLAPFGEGNPVPIIKINNLYVCKAKIINLKHISCLLGSSNKLIPNKSIHAMAFNGMNNAIGGILLSKKAYTMSLLGQINLNSWQGKENLQIYIHDIIL